MYAKFQSYPFSGLSCALIDQSVKVAIYMYIDYFNSNERKDNNIVKYKVRVHDYLYILD